MISTKDKKTIIELSEQYDAKKVLLFGSSLYMDEDAADIDLAVEGVQDYYKFYGDLMLKLSKPVDLVDLSKNNKFNRIVQHEGLVIYG